MEHEQSLRRLRADRLTLVAEHPRQPQGLPGSLPLIDVDFAAACVHQHEPRKTRPDDEPDDEQPPVELGVHRGEV